MKSLFSYSLTAENGEAAGKQWRLFQDVVTLGRHETNHVVLTYPTVSKQQCRILANDGTLRIENLSQSNQTRLNGEPVDKAELNDGDLIQMGDLEVRVSTHEDQVIPVEEGAGALDNDPPTAAIDISDVGQLPANDNRSSLTSSSSTSSVVGQYTIESKIAQSGQAILFKGRDETNGETVALKLFTHDETDQVSEARFQRELKILKQLSHKNIVEYRGLFETTGEWGETKRYLVMEYLQGKTLKELIEENPKGMEWETVRSIFKQCLLGLIHASKEHNIIHRDIKPSNILILEDGTAKLIDFGISRYDSESTHTGGSGMMGSFDYMAPDFALADDAKFRGNMVSDIFSLFVCLYQALTGSLPYPKYGERQELEYLSRWRASDIKRPSHKHIVFRVVAHLGGFIDQGLAVESSKRHQSFIAVLSALLELKNRVVVHEKIDSYALLSGLGSGGFGEVYLGERKSDAALVAIKRLHSERSSKRFIKEATILSRYEHPSIVKYLDFFEVGGSSGKRNPFLVLEYLKGSTLNKQISEHPEGMDTKQVLQLFLCYLSALDFLHNSDGTIIHRDIKPGNLHVPIDDPSKAKIFDMGIVKDVSGTQTSGQLPGTYYYMAPEMFTTANRGTGQTDVYAMGLCMYEALSGAPAYPRLPKNDKDAIVEMIARAQGEKQYRVSYNHRAFRDHPDLVHIVQQSINADPQARYSDAKLMWEDIASVLEQHFDLKVPPLNLGLKGVVSGGEKRGAVKQGKAAGASSPGKRKKGRKGLVVGVGIVALLFVGGYAAARWQLDKIEPTVDSWPEPARGAVMAALTWPAAQEALPMVRAFQIEEQNTPEQITMEELRKKLQEEGEARAKLERELELEKKKEDERRSRASDSIGNDFIRDMEFLAYDGVNCNNYDEAGRSVERIARQYKDKVAMMYPVANNPYMQEKVKDFWAGQLGIIINGSNEREDLSLFAWANGVYLYAMNIYSTVMGGSKDIRRIQKELDERVAANTKLQSVGDLLPVLQKEGFSATPTGESAWWEKYVAADFPARIRALYLPRQAEGRINIFNGEAKMIRMDYVLVPFGMLTDQTPVAGNALKEIPSSPFYMAVAETTVEQMQAFRSTKLDAAVSDDGTGPCSTASLEDAIGFCNWLSKQDQLEPLYELKQDRSGWNLDLRKPGYRLPFDFEWEYAARFGYDFFPMTEGLDWKVMKADWDKKVDEQASFEDINGGLVNYYYLEKLRSPQESHAYPLGIYDLCGNAPEICMTTEKMPKNPKVVEVEFIQMLGGKSKSDIGAVAPWLNGETPNGIQISDKDKAEYGFRVIRAVPVHLID
jgi:serine/threonine protein kinase